MSSKISRLWQELKSRKVLPFLIGYVAACFAIIGFVLDASETFSLQEKTIKLLYLLSAIGIPAVILLPWFINRKKQDLSPEDLVMKEIPAGQPKKKALHNLPIYLSSFIGREKEIEIIKQHLTEKRLVTLTGAGGCGKTRLAIQTATEVLSEYPDGVWVVELAPVTVPEHIDEAIAEIFGIKEQPGSTLLQLITHYLENKKLLLLLDNCEHLVTACSEIVEQILKSAADVTILITSREALNVTDELAWRVPSLSLPQNGKELSASEADRYEAVQLFAARAKNRQPDFHLSDQNATPVLQLCKRLDGIPLAIELAASRINVLHPELILSRLNEQFRLLTGGSRTALERHKTLQATIDWSYDLLAENEKQVFHQLSVFVNGFDLEAFEHICGNSQTDQRDLLDLISLLVDKSLVISRNMEDGTYRYQLLETIRHYAKEKLLESGESDAVRESHYQYFHKLCEQAYKENTSKFGYWVAKLETEHENIIAALEWVRHDLKKRLQLAGVLGWFWYEHNHYTVGLEYLKDAEDCPSEATLIQVRAISSHSFILLIYGDAEGMLKVDASLVLLDKLENREEKVKSLYPILMIKSAIGEYEYVQGKTMEMEEIARELNDDYLLLRARTARLFNHICQLKVDLAEPLAVQNLKDMVRINDQMMIPFNLHFYGDCALIRKDYKETEKRYSLAMKRYMEHGNQLEATVELQGLSFTLSGQGRYPKALRLNGAVEAKRDEFGVSSPPVEFWMDWYEEYVNGARRAVGEKEAVQYELQGRVMGFEKAQEYALDFEKD